MEDREGAVLDLVLDILDVVRDQGIADRVPGLGDPVPAEDRDQDRIQSIREGEAFSVT